MPMKKDESTFYESPKVIHKTKRMNLYFMNHQKLFTKQEETHGADSHGTYILILELQETSQGCLAD